MSQRLLLSAVKSLGLSLHVSLLSLPCLRCDDHIAHLCKAPQDLLCYHQGFLFFPQVAFFLMLTTLGEWDLRRHLAMESSHSPVQMKQLWGKKVQKGLQSMSAREESKKYLSCALLWAQPPHRLCSPKEGTQTCWGRWSRKALEMWLLGKRFWNYRNYKQDIYSYLVWVCIFSGYFSAVALNMGSRYYCLLLLFTVLLSQEVG